VFPARAAQARYLQRLLSRQKWVVSRAARSLFKGIVTEFANSLYQKHGYMNDIHRPKISFANNGNVINQVAAPTKAR
jgi:hypothetical protein